MSRKIKSRNDWENQCKWNKGLILHILLLTVILKHPVLLIKANPLYFYDDGFDNIMVMTTIIFLLLYYRAHLCECWSPFRKSFWYSPQQRTSLKWKEDKRLKGLKGLKQLSNFIFLFDAPHNRWQLMNFKGNVMLTERKHPIPIPYECSDAATSSFVSAFQ